MIELSFQSLKRLLIWSNKGVFSIPNGQHLLEIDGIVSLLNEIDEHYKIDIDKNKTILISSHLHCQNALDSFNGFKARELWRIGSYIIFSLNLEGVLKRVYKETFDVMNEVEPGNSVEYKKLIEERKGEIKHLKYYRNKIFAHPAFGSPRKENNLSMQRTSLAYFSGSFVSKTSEGIQLGGGAVVVGGQDAPHFEQLTFKSLVKNFDTHIQNWYEMYKYLTKTLCAVNDKHVKEYFEQHGCKVEKIQRIK